MSISYLKNQNEIDTDLKSFLNYLHPIHIKLNAQGIIEQNAEPDINNLSIHWLIGNSKTKYENILQHLRLAKDFPIADLAELTKNDFRKYSRYVLKLYEHGNINNEDEQVHTCIWFYKSLNKTSNLAAHYRETKTADRFPY